MPVVLPDASGERMVDLLNAAITGFGSDESDPVTNWSSAADGDGVEGVICYANRGLMMPS